MKRIAVFGGIYNNYLALDAALADAQQRGAEAVYCLGDVGAFGPYPDRVFPLLHEHGVQCIQGNYDNSVGNGRADCQCGYTDPRDNHFARLSYAYTFANTSLSNRAWLRDLPAQRRVELGRYRLLLCHGSPRRTNEFLWESTTSAAFLNHLMDVYLPSPTMSAAIGGVRPARDTPTNRYAHGEAYAAILATHTGIKWHRPLTNDRHFVNVGVLGRPENDGTTNVWYTMLSADPDLRVEFVPVHYDHERLAAEMRAERLPDEFVETVLTGWWTTCLEILPAKERRRGRF